MDLITAIGTLPGLPVAVSVIASLLGIILAGYKIHAWFARFKREWSETIRNFFRDWNGEPGRPGHDRIPGVPERLQFLERDNAQQWDALHEMKAEFKPNHGSTARDAIDRIESVLGAIEERLDRLEPK